MPLWQCFAPYWVELGSPFGKLVGFSLVVCSMVKDASFLCQFLSRLKVCRGHCKRSALVRDLQTEKNYLVISHIIHFPGNPWGFGIQHNLVQSIDIRNICSEQRPRMLFAKFPNTSTNSMAFKSSINIHADSYSILFLLMTGSHHFDWLPVFGHIFSYF